MADTIQRLPSVKADSGLSRSTLYLLIARGLWPRPVRLGARAVGWPRSEVEAMIAARIAGKDEAAIAQLVKSLEAARKSAA